MTQNEQVIAYMERYGSITALDAMRDLGCMRLASRISDIKKGMMLGEGRFIIKESKEVLTRDGRKTHVAKYRIGGING